LHAVTREGALAARHATELHDRQRLQHPRRKLAQPITHLLRCHDVAISIARLLHNETVLLIGFVRRIIPIFRRKAWTIPPAIRATCTRTWKDRKTLPSAHICRQSFRCRSILPVLFCLSRHWSPGGPP